MQRALNQLGSNMARVNFLIGTYAVVETQTTAAIDVSDILRAAVVQSVSALDHFIHELQRLGVLEIHAGARPATPTYHLLVDEFRALSQVDPTIWPPAEIDAAIRERNSWRTFQQPQKIAEALSLVTTAPIWAGVAQGIHLSASDVQTRIRVIVDRRNKIAHEADMDPSFPGARWPITQRMLEDTSGWIENLGTHLFGTLA
jgi:hypothetical protein